jgi:hypothetical protein
MLIEYWFGNQGCCLIGRKPPAAIIGIEETVKTEAFGLKTKLTFKFEAARSPQQLSAFLGEE